MAGNANISRLRGTLHLVILIPTADVIHNMHNGQ